MPNLKYCRWSSNSYRSDVHCQRTALGFETHVAVLRRVLSDNEFAPPAALFGLDPERFDSELRSFTRALDLAHRIPIGLAHDGAVFVDETEDDMFERVTALAEAGYRVPTEMLAEAHLRVSKAVA